MSFITHALGRGLAGDPGFESADFPGFADFPDLGMFIA
jgi:hypothetical protein